MFRCGVGAFGRSMQAEARDGLDRQFPLALHGGVCPQRLRSDPSCATGAPGPGPGDSAGLLGAATCGEMGPATNSVPCSTGLGKPVRRKRVPVDLDDWGWRGCEAGPGLWSETFGFSECSA